MRLTVITFLTLDGVMQSPGGADEDTSGGFDLGGWLPPHVDVSVCAYLEEVLGRAGALLLGRRTYDIMAGYWPHTEPRAGGAEAIFNQLPKYVATTQIDELAWSDSCPLSGELAPMITDLKNRPGGELQVHGSGVLARSLLAEGLVDGYRLLIVPVVLGYGRRLFANGVPPAGLRLLESRTSSSGVLMLTYENSGGPAFDTWLS